MAVADQVLALRRSVALAEGEHIACARVSGAGAFDLIDRVSPRELQVRSGQILHTLLLDDEARPVADVYLCCDEDDFLVVAEGPTGAALTELLRGHAGGLDVAVTDLTPTHGVLCLNGPYAWELMAELVSPDVIGLPYLGFFHDERFTCLRGGKCGEYGYDLLVPRERMDAVRGEVRAVGERFDLADASLEALEVAGLEAFFWNARRQAAAGATPIELQLQWRVTSGRSFPGSAALEARRAAGPRERAVLLASDRELTAGAAVQLDGRAVGRVVHAAASPTRGDALAFALLERPLAHAGLSGFAVDGAAVRTISAPAVNNRSLYVDPQRHAYASRDGDDFPPLVRA